MAVQFRDYYETLGVSKTATEDEVRSAFRKLARKHHPDVDKDKKAAEEKFKEINEAYEVLSDAEKRKKYDQLGAGWNQPGGFQPPPGWEAQQPGGGFQRFFRGVFRRRPRPLGFRRIRRASGDGRTRGRRGSRHHGHAGRSSAWLDQDSFVAPRRFEQSGKLSGQNSARCS